jgi:predicted dehydrogenase
MMSAAGAAALAAQDGNGIRTAHIGAGNRGKGLIRQVLNQPGVRITAVCDTDANARDAGLSLAQRDSPRAFTDWRSMLDFREIDAVVIATPCYLHAEMAAACLEAGKYVYCEKPLGITPEQVQLVLNASRRAKTFLQIGQQLRYFPTVREAVRQIHSEDPLGRTLVIKAQRHSGPLSPEAEARRPAWYKDVRYSGDLIVENAVHTIDVCNWIANSRPVAAFGHGMKYFPRPRWAGTVMMDGFSVEYVYLNGVHLDYSQLYMHPRGLKKLANGQWYTVFGQNGALDMTHEGAEFYGMNETSGRDIIPADLKDKKENAMQEFYACIRENRRPFAGVEVGATAALTTIMGREAIYRGRSVSWDISVTGLRIFNAGPRYLRAMDRGGRRSRVHLERRGRHDRLPGQAERVSQEQKVISQLCASRGMAVPKGRMAGASAGRRMAECRILYSCKRDSERVPEEPRGAGSFRRGGKRVRCARREHQGCEARRDPAGPSAVRRLGPL